MNKRLVFSAVTDINNFNLISSSYIVLLTQINHKITKIFTSLCIWLTESYGAWLIYNFYVIFLHDKTPSQHSNLGSAVILCLSSRYFYLEQLISEEHKKVWTHFPIKSDRKVCPKF